MNQYEKLIEYIINEQEDKARELFHQIVVEKSREIYENLIDETDFDEEVGGSGNEVEDLINDIEVEKDGIPEDQEIEDETTSDMDDMDGMDDMDDTEGEESGEEGLEDRVMDLESALEDLKVEFDKLMADEMDEPEHADMFGSDEAMGDVDGDGDHDMDDHDAEDEMVREYVEKVAAGHGADKKGGSEGSEIGTGGSVGVNKQSIVAGKNNMGGSSANIAKGGFEQAADGKPTPQPSNQYTKGKGNLPGAGNFENVPGAKTKGYTNKQSSRPNEGQTTGSSMSVDKKSIVGGKVR